MTRTLRVPRITVTVDGGPLPAAALAAVEALTVAQRVNLPDQLVLVVRGPAPAPLSPGADLRVDVEGQRLPLFIGTVVAVEHEFGPDGARTTRVRGYDALHALRLDQDVAVHEGASLGSLAQAWGETVGVSTQVSADGPKLARVVQPGQSALEVLQQLSARSGVHFHLRQQTLHVFGPDGVGDPVPLRWGETLREARLDLNAAAGARPVQVGAWDPLVAASVTAEESGQGNGPDAGAVGASGPVRVAGGVASSDEEASALARAHAERRAATARALWGVADGDPRLRPGAVVEIAAGPSPDDDVLAGRYTLTAVTHRVDDRAGYSSELSSAATEPAPAATAAAADVQLGTVADVNDPESRGRVAVTLDALDAVATEWLQVLTPAAGPDKGLIMLPEVGDHVLVLAPGADAGRGVVLGGLYGEAGAPDPGVVDGAVQRYTWRTSGGQLVRLDDSATAIRLEDATGSYVEMTPERVVVHAACDLTLEAPGKAITVTASSVDFKEG